MRARRYRRDAGVRTAMRKPGGVLGDAALDTGVPGAIGVEGDPGERGLVWLRPMSDPSIRRQWVTSACPHSLGIHRLEADERGRRAMVGLGVDCSRVLCMTQFRPRFVRE